MKRIELTEEQVKIIQNSMTKGQIATIREALAAEMERLRSKLCVLYAFDDILADALYSKEGARGQDCRRGRGFLRQRPGKRQQ